MSWSVARGAPRYAVASLAILGALVLSGCGGPSPTTSAGAARCIDLGADAVGLAWSQRGQFLAVGTVDANGGHAGRIIDPKGATAGPAVVDAGMRPATVVVTAEGRLAWISDTPTGRLLVEDRSGGRVSTPVAETVAGLGWTAIGFALLDHPAQGGSSVLNLDIDRPTEPTVTYQTDLFAEHLWIAADPETMVLTIGHPDHRDAPTSLLVVGPAAEHHLEPPGVDATGASMPALRRWVVYHSAATSRMEAVRVAEPGKTIVLGGGPAKRGIISDHGVLAYVPADPAGQVCLLDVRSSLP